MPLILLVGLGGVAVLAFRAASLVRSGKTQAVRALALGADVALLLIGAAVAAQWDSGGARKLSYVIVGSVVAGAAVHALGVVSWSGALAWTARAVGSILVCAALLVPSVLTLALPLVVLLALTLWSPAGTLRPSAR